MRGFHDAAMAEGQAVSVEFTSKEFFIQELDTIASGAASSVWDIVNCLCTANETVKHTNLKVEPCLLQTTPRHNDRSGPTPAGLTKLVEVHNLMGGIKLWSKQNAPNEVWAAAAASVGMDADADSGSGTGGGAIEARFKALEAANTELRKKVDGVTSTVQELATTVKDIGTNVNLGFAQLMQSNAQAQAALLARTQGSDASIAMIGHAVAGLPGASFVMPEPSAAAVTGYGGAGGTIANGAETDATNGTPMAVETVSETALATVAPMGGANRESENLHYVGEHAEIGLMIAHHAHTTEQQRARMVNADICAGSQSQRKAMLLLNVLTVSFDSRGGCRHSRNDYDERRSRRNSGLARRRGGSAALAWRCDVTHCDGGAQLRLHDDGHGDSEALPVSLWQAAAYQEGCRGGGCGLCDATDPGVCEAPATRTSRAGPDSSTMIDSSGDPISGHGVGCWRLVSIQARGCMLDYA